VDISSNEAFFKGFGSLGGPESECWQFVGLVAKQAVI
jgi:hypothetical protein